MLVSIVIPCYNSEHTVEEIADLTNEEFSRMDNYECEIIMVNDYSKDRTYEAIQRAAKKWPNVIGVNLAKNFGQQSAIMCALHYVHGDLVVGMDDDMQNHPSQIRQFLDAAEKGADVVFGVFKKRHFTPWKDFVGAISRSLLWKLLERPAGIQMSSFWLARRYVVEEAKKYKGNSAFIQALFFRTTYNIVNIDIDHFDREYGKSNYSFKKGLKLFLNFMNYSIRPLRFATYLGAVCSALGIISAIVVVIRKLIHPSMAAGWPSLMSVMLFLFGVVLLILGIIGEYVGRITLTQNNTPTYVIRETVNADYNDEKNRQAEAERRARGYVEDTQENAGLPDMSVPRFSKDGKTEG